MTTPNKKTTVYEAIPVMPWGDKEWQLFERRETRKEWYDITEKGEKVLQIMRKFQELIVIK
jgi:hypothetical protein